MALISENTPIRRKPSLLEAEIDEEIVALDVDGGECFGFNVVASAVWNGLAESTSVKAICTELTRTFEVEERVCRQEVLSLVQRLVDDGLVLAE